jgi:toxin YoeB
MICFHELAWEDYLYWQNIDRTKVKRINALVKECLRSPFSGIGKPEPLKGNWAGFWSRRIDEEHRLVYRFENATLTIAACHYTR